MIRFLLLAILFFLIARAFWSVVDGIVDAAGGSRPRRSGTPPMKLVKDPVCGTFVAPRQSMAVTTRDATYYFCSEQCRQKFQTHS